MTRKTLVFVGLASLVVLLGLGATGVAVANNAELAASVLATAHGAGDGFGHGFGRGPGHGQGMIRFIRDLDLTDEQLAHLETLHGIADQVHDRADPGAHVDRVLDRLDTGEDFDADEARALVDDHLEQMRVTAYAVTDELVALANSLDDEQRALLAEHLRQAREAHEAGDGHGARVHRMFRRLHGH